MIFELPLNLYNDKLFLELAEERLPGYLFSPKMIELRDDLEKWLADMSYQLRFDQELIHIANNNPMETLHEDNYISILFDDPADALLFKLTWL